ncbi:hypothetical protein [Otoolea muris]|jgi:hypothetical protein|uniref:hypothetical protein n=1 Tax=Otoolea muris TaxID=2941515 RepID=UPI00203F6047|nr:hypothetical protein [Otoolea muris]
MADLNEVKNMIRKGTVQSVNAGTMKARVKFGDKGGIVSGELHILTRHRAVVPTEKEKEGDKTKTAEGHFHEAYITEWVPQVGDMVLCLMIPDGDGEGYIVGKVM